MSASTATVRQPGYSQRKLMRAEAVVALCAAMFDRLIEALKIRPEALASDATQKGQATEQRWYGAFY